MSLQVFYPQDIRNALLAAEQASSRALNAINTQDDFAKGYREGYQDALATIALAFGLVRQVEPEPTVRVYMVEGML
jgi:soluble cytochrome b562